MTNSMSSRLRVLKIAALASVSLLALPALATAGTTGPVKPLVGNIQPFVGNIQPFVGNIQPFVGNIQPFVGNIQPFVGNIQPFVGNIQPFTGNISQFWGQTATNWNTLNGVWSQGDYTTASAQLNGMVASSAGYWGAAVQAQTGKNFWDGFGAAVFAKYGLKLDDASSLSNLDAYKRQMFFLDWYDGLMNYTGTDHSDWWMNAVNWTPALTQTQGYGADTVIGLLDFTVTGDSVIQQNIIKYDGVSNFSNGHGAAVASLMVGAFDGKGVMGIAPRASVIAYNPFDASGSANWDDITTGIKMLTANNASIVNMSLGVPGYTFSPDWNKVFSNLSVAALAKTTVFVTAAGNDGVTQTQNIPWNFLTNPNFIVVGSVDPTGKISSFSNRPGEACLTTLGLCLESNKLKYRFITAPGELLLVSDDKGGVIRQSGTSFAAPLVSGAIALLHDRWPWLANFPNETTTIILKSAKDLGAPGPDPVYGMGELDITASQSPLNFSALNWYQSTDGKNPQPVKLKDVLKTVDQAKTTQWDAKSMYFYAFETIGLTQRDFAIPLSSKLIGQDVTTINGAHEKFQDYLFSRMNDWVNSGAAATAASKDGFSNFAPSGVPIANGLGADIAFSLAPSVRQQGFRQQDESYRSKLSFDLPRFGFAGGYGDGAATLGGHLGLMQSSDYDSVHGGADPLLGLASGGAFTNVRFGVTDRLSLAVGVTNRDMRRDLRTLGENADSGAARYRAAAQHVTAAYRLTPGMTVTAGATQLNEASSLLGIQSMDKADLAGGSVTNGYSLGLDVDLGGDLVLSANGSSGHTRPTEGTRNLMVDAGGVDTSAFQVSLAKAGLFTASDRARLTLLQPMFIERGALSYTGVQVIDRNTGEIGLVTQSFDIRQDKRPLAAEMLYGRTVKSGAAEVVFFGRVETNTRTDTTAPTYIAGGRVRYAF